VEAPPKNWVLAGLLRKEKPSGAIADLPRATRIPDISRNGVDKFKITFIVLTDGRGRESQN